MRVKSVIFIVLCALHGSAFSDDSVAAARQHYERATSLYDVGRFADAAREYEVAYQLRNDPALLYNLGQAYRYAGEYRKAIFAYRGYLRRVPDADNRKEVDGFIAKSQQLLDQQDSGRPAPSDTKVKPAAQAQPAAPSLIPSAAVLAPTSLTSSPPRRRKPVYKQWWLWTTVSVVAAAGAGVGLYFAFTTPSGSKTTPIFPAVGSQP